MAASSRLAQVRLDVLAMIGSAYPSSIFGGSNSFAGRTSNEFHTCSNTCSLAVIVKRQHSRQKLIDIAKYDPG